MTDPTCRLADCDSPITPKSAKGLCPRHYQRQLATGTPTGSLRKPAIDRFLRRLQQAGDCWHWTGGRDGDGYGMFSDRSAHRWISRAHRWSYEFFIAEIPAGLELDHLCHNADERCPGGVTCPHRRCVNPWHLEPVPQEVNTRRAAQTRLRPNCPQGHPYDDDNTYINPLGRRTCRTCRHVSRQRYEQRRAA